MQGLNQTIWLFRITEIFLGFLGRCVRPKRRNIKISVKEYKRYTAETLLVQDQELQLNRFLNLYPFCLSVLSVLLCFLRAVVCVFYARLGTT